MGGDRQILRRVGCTDAAPTTGERCQAGEMNGATAGRGDHRIAGDGGGLGRPGRVCERSSHPGADHAIALCGPPIVVAITPTTTITTAVVSQPVAPPAQLTDVPVPRCIIWNTCRCRLRRSWPTRLITNVRSSCRRPTARGEGSGAVSSPSHRPLPGLGALAEHQPTPRPAGPRYYSDGTWALGCVAGTRPASATGPPDEDEQIGAERLPRAGRPIRATPGPHLRGLCWALAPRWHHPRRDWLIVTVQFLAHLVVGCMEAPRLAGVPDRGRQRRRLRSPVPPQGHNRTEPGLHGRLEAAHPRQLSTRDHRNCERRSAPETWASRSGSESVPMPGRARRLLVRLGPCRRRRTATPRLRWVTTRRRLRGGATSQSDPLLVDGPPRSP